MDVLERVRAAGCAQPLCAVFERGAQKLTRTLALLPSAGRLHVKYSAWFAVCLEGGIRGELARALLINVAAARYVYGKGKKIKSTTLSFIPVREYVTISQDPNERETQDVWIEMAQAHPLLTRQEEIELTQRIHAGDEKAQEQLILCNLRLVLKLALRYRRRNVPLVDLLQEGIGGLMQAIRHFDERRGFKFSTYSVHWIRQAVSRHIDRAARTIRLPSYILAMMGHQKRAADELERATGRAPTAEEVAASLGQKRSAVNLIDGLPDEPVPLETPVGNPEGNTTLSDVVEDTANGTHRDIDQWMRVDQVNRLMKGLTSREREVIDRRFGLTSGEGETLRAIAQKLDITKERVRQIEGQAMDKMKQRGMAQMSGRRSAA